MIHDIIKSRRAVYPAQYNGENISEEEIKRILEAANWAPTHRRTEPWRFKVMRDETLPKFANFLAETYKSKAANFSEAKYQKYQTNPLKAACVIAICMQRDPNESIPEWEEVASTAMAVQNMWLTASEMKIGAYWGSPSVIKDMGEFFKLAEGEKCLGFFYMGKYDGILSEGHRENPIEAKTTWL